MPKTVLITGTSSRIGHAAAKLFAAKGWNVAATMRNRTSTSASTLFAIANIRVFWLDVVDKPCMDAAVPAALDAFGGLDVVVNNAGFGVIGPLEFATQAQIERQYATNVHGVVYVMQAVLPYFRKKKAGLFVHVTSGWSELTLPFCSLDQGSKFAFE
jgi:NAD(P)-dependent dehydrogenase (short-subunit alcohol dehydrogenase family)